MSKITGEILIDRPIDVVVDFVTHERNEPLCYSALLYLGQSHRRSRRGGDAFSRNSQIGRSTC